MKSTKTFSVSFLPRRSKADPTQGILYARISVNNTRVEYSIKRKIPFDSWDQKRGKCTSKDQFARVINQYLSQVSGEIFESYDQLRKEGALITADTIKSRWLDEDSDDMTLLTAVEHHYKIEETTLKPGTLKNYRTTERFIKEFLSGVLKTSDIRLKYLRYAHLTQFENFLRLYKPIDHQKPMGNNTVMKHIVRLNKIVSMAVKLEWIEKNPFAHYSVHYDKYERVFLTDEELQKIMNKEISIDRLQFVCDLFVFACYTGLSYIDVIELTPENIMKGIDGANWIFTSRRKTDVIVKVPLLDQAQLIIDKYKDNPRTIAKGTLFPRISNQKLNAYLKELADICGIKKRLTFHVARHTFATTVTLSNGVPIATVSKLLGHTKITTTQIYAKVLEHKLSEDMADLRIKLKENNKGGNDQNDSKIIKVS